MEEEERIITHKSLHFTSNHDEVKQIKTYHHHGNSFGKQMRMSE